MAALATSATAYPWRRPAAGFRGSRSDVAAAAPGVGEARDRPAVRDSENSGWRRSVPAAERWEDFQQVVKVGEFPSARGDQATPRREPLTLSRSEGQAGAHRLWVLDMALRGIDVGPTVVIHGVRVGPNSRTIHVAVDG